MFVLG
jgi:hypothetical protein